jgi:hypothetical protein
MAKVLMAAAPTMTIANHHLAERGRTSPSSANHNCLGELLLCTITYVGSLPCVVLISTRFLV